MRLLFCHDGPMAVDCNGNAYPQTFTEQVLSRYYSIAKELVFFTRTRLIDPDETEAKKANMEKLTIVNSPNLSSIRGIAGTRKAKEILRDELDKSDCLIARLPSRIGALAVRIAVEMNKPYLVELVGCPWDSLRHHSWQGKMVAPFAYYGTKKIVEDAEYVVYVTSEFLQERYPTKGKWIACSDVALEESDDKILEARISKIKNKPKSEPIIVGTIGAVDIKYKGQQNVIKALARLKEQGLHNFQYQLVGDGDQSYLRSVAQKFGVAEQVKFLGKMSHQEVFKWLDSIDVYIQPSKTEGLPRSLIEAMSRGLPCFGSRAGGIPELLDDDYLFSNTRTNADEIAELLEGLTKDCMEEQAWRNFMQSRSYEKRFLDAKRQRFFREFQQSVGTRMGS
jgi:glycosyltransferase involved in cell wall biosynthesis